MAAPSTFPTWVFDNSPIPDPLGHGERAVQFLRALRHIKSDQPGRAFTLYDWQERIVRAIYGPRDADGDRLVTRVFFYIPRGNRKTTLSAALSLLHLIGPEKRPGGELYFAASDKGQASIAFKELTGIIKQDKRILQKTKIVDQRNAAREVDSLIPGFESKLKVVSSDGSRLSGTSPSFAFCDEICEWKEAAGAKMIEIIESGVSKVKNPLIITATTAGRGDQGFAADQYAYAREVALGRVTDPTFLPIMFEIQSDEDWTDETVWHRCNPGLQYGFQNVKDLRAKVAKAKNMPSAAYGFQQYHLNKWHGNSRDPLFDLATYDARAFADDDADLEQLPAYIGVDMSQSGDLTAVAIAFRHADGQVTLRNTCFVPEADLAGRAHRDRAPYRQWADDGLIQLCPGGVIDQKQVEDHVRDLCARYDVQEIAVDPARARVLLQNLSDDGLPVFTHPQSAVIMSEATGNLIRTVHGDMIRHDADPVLRLHFDNVAMSTNPQSGLVRMHKQRSTGRIDAAVASAMAVSRAVTAHNKKSRYSDPDVLGLMLL